MKTNQTKIESPRPNSTMDIAFSEEDISLPQVALYSSISFLVVSLVGVFLYITCSRKYKLNWFEKNLLETASENEAVNSAALASRCVSLRFRWMNEGGGRSGLYLNVNGMLSFNLV